MNDAESGCQATEIDEYGLVDFLAIHPIVRPKLLTAFGLADQVQIYRRIDTNSYFPGVKSPGDIDLLLVPLDSPGRTIAIEVKRVKITEQTFIGSPPGKAKAVRKGIAQVGALHDLGFHQTYLMIIVVTDGRSRSEFNFAGKVATPVMLDQVQEMAGLGDLGDTGIGIVVAHIIQPVDKPIHKAGMVGIGILKQAAVREQSAQSSEAVAQLKGLTDLVRSK